MNSNIYYRESGRKLDEVLRRDVGGFLRNGRGVSGRSGSIRTGGERDSLLPLAGNKEKANLSRSRYVEEVTIAL